MSDRPALTCDKILKAILANPECIRDLLQEYICAETAAAELDLEHIELLRTEFADAETRRYFQSDMLWKIAYKDRGRQPLYLALLLELQSCPCHHMALRMLNYIVQFYLSIAENRPADEAYPLPDVIPVVFYTGRRRWNAPLCISGLTAKRSTQTAEDKPLIDFEYLLLNVPKTALKGAKNSLLWLLMDSLRTDDKTELANKWQAYKDVLPQRNTNIDAWRQLFAMIARQIKGGNMSVEWSVDTEYPYVTMDEFGHLLDEEGTIIVGEERMRLLGRAEGRAEGRTEGRSEGRAEGRAEGCTETMLTSLKNLTESMKWTLDEAMNALRVPEAERPKFRKMLEAEG